MMISMDIKFSLQIEVITIFGKKKFRSITYKNIIYDVFTYIIYKIRTYLK
jgi:hypothetical protein